MPKSVFYGKIQGGKLGLRDRDGFERVKQFLDGKEIELTIEEYRKRRSRKQNNWYFGAVLPAIAEHLGYERYNKDELQKLHEALKKEILGTKTIKAGNTKLEITNGTKTLDTLEFTNYVETVRRWAAKELGLNIEDPS